MDTIGEILKKARLAKGLTIDELQKITKIQIKYLEAMEEDRFDLLPGSYYARNFIRQYSQVVGIDGEYMVDLFDGIAPKKRPSADRISGSRKELNKGRYGASNQSAKSIIPTILLTLVSLLIIAGVIYLTLRENSKKPHIDTQNSVMVETSQEETEKSTILSTEASTEQQTTESSEPEKVEKPVIKLVSESGSESEITVENAKAPLELTFEGVNGDCWIGIMVNGQYIYDQTLSAGISETTALPEGTESATLILGAATNVTLKINGEAFDFNQNGTNIVKRNLNLTISYQE